MINERSFPDDPTIFIKDCLRCGRIFWTYHVNIRLSGRFIPRDSILKTVDTIEIIESYPDDKYFPSYLVYSRLGDDAFHVLVAVDVPGDNVRIVTAYRPDDSEWLEDRKTRRPKQ